MNIVSMAAQYLTPMIVDKLAGALGINSAMARMAISAILPSLMGGIMKTSSSPSGLSRLTDLLGKQDTSQLGKLGDIVGGSGQTSMVNAGTDALSSLLGGSGLTSLTSAVGKFAGVGSGPAKSLVGLLGPIALGTIAKEQQSSGLDASGLARMLAGQKQNIADALPKGFSDLLGNSGLLDGVVPSSAARSQAPAPSTPTRSMSTPARDMGHPVHRSNNIVWLAAGLAAALAGWHWFAAGNRSHLPDAPAITFQNRDVGAAAGSVVEGLRGALVGIKDEATARAALPSLQHTAKELSGLGDVQAQLPANAKKELAGYIGSAMPIVRPLIDHALATAGVGPIAKPVLDQILGRLVGLAKG